MDRFDRAERKTYRASYSGGGVHYVGTLIVDGDKAMECVVESGANGGRIIHEAEFDVANLGEASRDGYCRAMLASAVRNNIWNAVNKLRGM